MSQEKYEEFAKRDCDKAVKANSPYLDKFNCPLTGPKMRVDPYAAGRRPLNKKKWVAWTKEELDKRQKNRKEAEAARQPILARIKNGYPTRMPDPQ